MLASYLSIIRRHPSVIAFGFFATLFSNFGQTFFIGLYSEYFQTAFGLSNTQFGGVYSGVTLASAGALLLLGHMIDKVHLRRYVAYACVALAAGCLTMAHATTLPVFVIGLWLVRFHGQGVMTHMSATVTAREISEGRGGSLSLTVLGQPLGEIVLPLLFTVTIALVEWRTSWQAYGLFYLLFALPMMLWLAPCKAIELPDTLDQPVEAEQKMRHVFKDKALWLLLIANMLMPFLITGIVFHQKWLMEDLGFTTQLYAMSLTGFGVGHAVSGLLAGGVVDRVGSVKVLRLFLLPFIAATLGLVFIGYWWMLPLFMLATALSAGCTHSARGSFLAERYGTKQLGAIKSLFTSSMVFSTALSPLLFGWIIDTTAQGVMILHLSWISAVLAFGALQFLGRDDKKKKME